VLNRVAVVVPAHDEQDLLPACLAALARSAAVAAPLAVEVIVVADSCTDGTAALARRAGAEIVEVHHRNVGRARAAGMRYALRHGPAGLWLATTDADSLVGAGWLAWHRDHATAGTEVLAGTVAVAEWALWPEAVRTEYDARYQAAMTATGHRHVHGANLGCDAAVYAELGGFAALDYDEDRDLVARAHVAGKQVTYDRGCPVVTSARRAARAPHGFAAHIAGLETAVS
jgi:glycosyltransferase involved in cell wall biosynthesis